VSRAWAVEDVDPDAPVIDNARRVLAVRIAEFYSFEPIVSHAELSVALHDMRISAKRLRYTLELFRPQFGKAGERQIERVKAIQELLGTPDELAAIAAAALRPPPDDPRRGLIALLGREHAARRATYAQFRELWDTYAGDGMRRELVTLSVKPLPDRRGSAPSMSPA
jgi:CHAD domain-containing protein